MYDIRKHISQLYDLPKDKPIALAQRIDDFLKRDRFMGLPRKYDVRL